MYPEKVSLPTMYLKDKCHKTPFDQSEPENVKIEVKFLLPCSCKIRAALPQVFLSVFMVAVGFSLSFIPQAELLNNKRQYLCTLYFLSDLQA